MVIAIPTGVKIFNWLFTMYRGRITFTAPMVWFMCFVFTFTLGGVTGVILAVPALDFQVHNSLFLVAHFHNVIIGGVVFGFIAALTYWWPKMFGFRLHDGLGKTAAYFWQVGFLLAFMPLYALGLMGAVRRLDHYTDPEWVPFFIVSGVGVVVIGLGAVTLVAQIAYSVWKRKELKDTTGDPWDGRTLEWSVSSPAPEYNFATIPVVRERDEWWRRKQKNVHMPAVVYEDIFLPKPSSLGVVVAIFVGLAAFGIIWHMWWLTSVGTILAIVTIIWKTMNDDSEFMIPAKEVQRQAEGKS